MTTPTPIADSSECTHPWAYQDHNGVPFCAACGEDWTNCMHPRPADAVSTDSSESGTGGTCKHFPEYDCRSGFNPCKCAALDADKDGAKKSDGGCGRTHGSSPSAMLPAASAVAGIKPGPSDPTCACLRPGGDPLGNCEICDPPAPTPAQSTAGEPVAIVTYRNWRGEVSERRIVPQSVDYGSTTWHPEPQWLLRAWDDDKQAFRDFALKDFGAALSAAPVGEPFGFVRTTGADHLKRSGCTVVYARDHKLPDDIAVYTHPPTPAVGAAPPALTRQFIIDLVHNEYDPKPDLGDASYKAFDDSWDDGTGRIADAILDRLSVAPAVGAEEVARIIDPVAWTTQDRMGKFVTYVNGIAPSLEKADAILSLLSIKAGE